MTDAMILVGALRDPDSAQNLAPEQWTALLTIARAEQLIGTLACRLEGQAVPDRVKAILADARLNAEVQRCTALWEADCAWRALAEYDGKVVLMKGTAYVASDLRAGQGRSIGDLDIMVAQPDLPTVEAKLLAAGWEWVKQDAYDDAYYRDHMHELPPMIHRERDRMIDVHHTILPLTARPRPDAAAMLADAVPLPLAGGGRGGDCPPNAASVDIPPTQLSPIKGRGLFIFAPEDMACHCAAHLFADGDLAGALRNLWDFHCLTQEFAASDSGFRARLSLRAKRHGLTAAVERAQRLADLLYGSGCDRLTVIDRLFIRRLTARNGYGQQTRKFTRLVFYIRSHALRMPPMMLARHLWTKWRKGHQPKL
jgi:hypothetical protein